MGLASKAAVASCVFAGCLDEGAIMGRPSYPRGPYRSNRNSSDHLEPDINAIRGGGARAIEDPIFKFEFIRTHSSFRGRNTVQTELMPNRRR